MTEWRQVENGLEEGKTLQKIRQKEGRCSDSGEGDSESCRWSGWIPEMARSYNRSNENSWAPLGEKEVVESKVQFMVQSS